MVGQRETGGREHPTLEGGREERDAALKAGTAGDPPADEGDGTAHRNDDPDRSGTGQQYHDPSESHGAHAPGDPDDPERTRNHMSGARG